MADSVPVRPADVIQYAYLWSYEDHEGHGVQVPPQTCARLGLDDQAPCWIITTEMNQFVWPGPDIRKTPAGRQSYGLMPATLFNKVRAQLLANHAQGMNVIFRTDD